jgi:hypothetical protein
MLRFVRMYKPPSTERLSFSVLNGYDLIGRHVLKISSDYYGILQKLSGIVNKVWCHSPSHTEQEYVLL